MDESITIDILMATYNGEKYIEEQIQSILNQDYQNFRLIISDDASTDSTREIITKSQKLHPTKIFLLPPDINLGVVGNFSKLMEMSEAKYCMFADQDDVWLPFKIKLTLEKMFELERKYGLEIPLLVVTDLIVVDENLKMLDHSFWKLFNIKPELGSKINRILVRGMYTGCTMMINRQLLDLSCPIPKESITHDYWIGLVAPVFGKIGIIYEPTILYRTHSKNVMGTWAAKASLSHLIHSGQRFHIDSAIRAYVFYRRFSSLMDEDAKDIFKAYIMLKSNYFLKEFLLRCKYGFFRDGVKANIVLLGSSLKMGKIKQISQLRLD